MTRPRIATGSPEPLGVTPTARGVNVAVFSAHATGIDVCLFDASGDKELERFPLPERTGAIWHGEIEGIGLGARYGLRAYGPYDPLAGHRFNPHKLLVDPYARALDRRFILHPSMFGYVPGEWDLSFSDVDSAPHMPKAIVTAPDAPGTGQFPLRPWEETILYELNVRGFSRLNAAVPEARRGTFAGLAHPASVAHLKSLGVTAVEIMPAAAWIDERHLGPLGLTNAWGYNPVALAAPELKLAPGGWADVKAAVDALHAAGIEVIVDIVLNHSGEGDELGPTVSFRGLDNASYYRLRPDNPGRYIDDMGCGNCLALDRPHMVHLAMEAMRTWVRRAGIDGFRFDLAPALGRRPEGFDPAAPLIAALAQDPELRGLRLIAEPWDIGPGGYQTGNFPAGWGEWNDRYRDDVRRYWRGDGGLTGDLATRLAGSSDLFARKTPARGINFVTAHDGFTLADLVSHTVKHNAANGENNRDGTDANHAWNHGIEGASDDPVIRAARRRDQINLLATLLLSRGTPMLSMGAECGHSQQGNNNAYAQDNPIGWLDWAGMDGDMLAATRALIAARRRLGLIAGSRFLTGRPLALDDPADAAWLRPDGAPMTDADWADPHRAVLILALAGDGRPGGPEQVLLAFNRGDHATELTLPEAAEGRIWTLAVDTSAAPLTWGRDTLATGDRPRLAPRSVLALSLGPDPARAGKPAPARRETIDRLAAAAGIAPDWWDVGGTNHTVPPETKRALLTAMGLDVSSQPAARDALEHLAETMQRRLLPATLHGTEGAPVFLPLALSSVLDRAPPQLVITDEAGGRITVETGGSDTPRQRMTGWDGRPFDRAGLTLPPLPVGHYRLTTSDGRHDGRLTIAPRRCWQGEEATRAFGLSAQLYTLRSARDQGIGDFSTLARMAGVAGAAGAATLGINPVHALFPFDRSRASPYHPSDRRFIDPVYIDVTDLGDLPSSPIADALLAAAMPEFEALRASRTVDYARIAALKTAILNARFEAFRTAFYGGTDGTRRSFLAFVEAGGAALESFATFRLIEATRQGERWQDWPDGLDRAASRAARATAEADPQGLAREMFLQWLADRQLGKAAEAARAAGLPLGLYRDLAVGCAPDGAEAWSEGARYAHGVSVGAPPDPFSANGQVWNLPPPNPLTMAEGGYAAFRALLAANMRHAGLLRIDHVMGLTRLFWVPDGAKGSDGAYVAYPRDALLAELKLESRRHRTMVVGEDLGTVPEGFREALAEAGVLSYRVLWFERQGEGLRPAGHYPEAAVACVATHDLATLAGWWSGADLDEAAALGLIADTAAAHAARRREKAAVIASLVAEGVLAAPPAPEEPLTADIAAAFHAFVARSPARLAFVQVDDLTGETEAVNLPGTDRERPNWRRRLDVPVETLLASDAARAILAAAGAGRGGTISLPSGSGTAMERHDPARENPALPAAGAADSRAGARLADAGAGPSRPR